DFRCISSVFLATAWGPPDLELDVASFNPAELLKSLPQGRNVALGLRVVRGGVHHDADTPHPLGLLRARCKRPRRRAAKQGDELAPPHSITSSARARSVGGISTSSALAVL